MWVRDLSNWDIVLALFVAVALAGLVAWLVPAARRQQAAPRRFSGAEITAYDRQLPYYALFALGALVVGAVQGLLKNLPGPFQWLILGDHGGHMARDLSNTHIFVVGVGTVLLTGLTWYILPRIARRPLYSAALANASFWLTAIGVSGFYLSWVVLGVLEARLVHEGMSYPEAKEAMGLWHRVPLRSTALFLGLGYWTYTLNTLLTLYYARQVEGPKPYGYLLKFFAVGVLGLFVGTVQGVLQVLPANEDWIQAAGQAGALIDPTSHAHINLVTGSTALLVAAFLYLGPRLGLEPVRPGTANRLFVSLVLGSLAFYLAALTLGFVEGYMVVDGRLSYSQVLERMGLWHTLPLMLGGLWMGSGLWFFLFLLVRSARNAAPAVRATVYTSAAALLVGTFLGPFQAIAPVKEWYVRAGGLGEFWPSSHALLNILGGLTPLIALLALSRIPGMNLPALGGAAVWLGRGAFFIYAGLAYLGAQAALLAGVWDAASRPPAPSVLPPTVLSVPGLAGQLSGVSEAERLHALALANRSTIYWVNPEVLQSLAPPAILLELLGFGLYLFGAVALVRLVWPLTASFQAQVGAALRAYPAQVMGPVPNSLRKVPKAVFLGVEGLGALTGFPGLGWLLSGAPVVGLSLAMIGPGIAWALLPALFSPYSTTLLSPYGVNSYLVYFPLSALLSTAALAYRLRGHNARPSRGHPSPRPALRSARRARRLGVGLGIFIVGAILLSTLLVPLLGTPSAKAQYLPVAAPPAEGRGVYLHSGTAYLKPYPWYNPPPGFPPDSARLPGVSALVVQEKRTGELGSYRLIALGSSRPVALRVVQRGREGGLERLELRPIEALAPGRYLLQAEQTASPYGGQVEYYFEVDPTLPPLVPAAQTPERKVQLLPPALFSPLAALVALWLAGLLWRSYRRSRQPQLLWWALGVSAFALATGLEALFPQGWQPWAYRLWYSAGALLAAAFLGHGTAVLLLPRYRRSLTLLLLAYAGLAVLVALWAPVDLARLEYPLSGQAYPSVGEAGLLTPRSYTPLLNLYGTVWLVLGALLSLRSSVQRAPGLWAIALGGLMMGSVGSLNRLGYGEWQSLGALLSIALIYGGVYLLSPARKAPAVAPEGSRRPATL